MNTNKRYTVILSADLPSASADENLVATENLARHFENVLRLNTKKAIGYYKGELETSFVVHTNSIDMAWHLMDYALRHLNQESVLVSCNADTDIRLYYSGRLSERIGSHFVANDGDGVNYTLLDGKPWSVAA